MKIIITVLLIVISNMLYSQNKKSCDDTVSMSGYLVKIFDKGHLAKQSRANAKRGKNKSFTVAIDLTSKVVFVVDTATNSVSNRILNLAAGDEVFLMCEKRNDKTLTEFICNAPVKCSGSLQFSRLFYRIRFDRKDAFQK